MGHGDDGLFVPASGHQALVSVVQGAFGSPGGIGFMIAENSLTCSAVQGAFGSPGGIGCFAQQIADGVVAFTGLASLAADPAALRLQGGAGRFTVRPLPDNLGCE